jgi:hypothetical protein
MISKEIDSSDKKEIKTWSISTRVGSYSKDISVEKLDGPGYLIKICISGDNKKGEYKYIEKKFYSETNPIEDKKEEKESKENTDYLEEIKDMIFPKMDY